MEILLKDSALFPAHIETQNFRGLLEVADYLKKNLSLHYHQYNLYMRLMSCF